MWLLFYFYAMFKRDPLQIIVFKTSGTSKRFYLRGRALQDENIDLDQKGLASLLLNTWKRFETDEIKSTTLVVQWPDGSTDEVVTDKRGYFLIDAPCNGLDAYMDKEGWVTVVLSYKNKPKRRHIQFNNKFYGAFLIPSPHVDFGIISDIDDTILHTGVASTLKWQVLYNTFFKSAGNRIALKGAAEFYHLLHQGKTGAAANPVFYVSHSPWNLYRYIDYFLKKNNFPKGPIVLRNFPRLFRRKSASSLPEKHQEILKLLQMHSDLKFILIGDSGEHDPDIYLEIANAYPNRILAIYLRNVAHLKKMKRVTQLFENFDTIPVLLVENSMQAITHARQHGFIA